MIGYEKPTTNPRKKFVSSGWSNRTRKENGEAINYISKGFTFSVKQYFSLSYIALKDITWLVQEWCTTEEMWQL